MMTQSLCWINGQVLPLSEARLSPMDRGAMLGDGVFETILMRNGRLIWVADHLRRLREGAEVLSIPVPMEEEAMRSGLIALAEAAGLTDAALRLTLTRGEAAKRGIWPPGEPVCPVLYATIAAKAADTLILPPVRVAVCATTRRNADSPLSRIKSLAYGDAILARQEAERRGAQDAVLLNTRGDVACAAAGNVFIGLENGAWVTPALECGILPGLTRARLIPRLKAREESVSVETLRHASRLLIVNSLGCTMAASIMDGNGESLLATELPFDTDLLYRCMN
ncbi:4-amino-4-deoxychorismate lyase [Granulibacter bethesdensis CGDNIH4]|nr:4-amino-4-deoxychorismate lyase [Granulibacter bethesdensis CGDNIH4]